MSATDDHVPEYHFRCAHCGRLVDMRNLAAVMSHADTFTGLKVCLTDEQIRLAEEQFGPTTARKVGEAIEWRDGKPTNLN